MNDLIPVVNKLQDVFNTIGSETVDLPQIIVVGSQSSGKSSVLENLVQRDFLPRGSGIVTRRPLVLQLVNVQDSEDSKAVEYGEFLHMSDRKFTDFSEIRKEIEAETARVAGQNKGISRSPIHLKIYSPKVLNLTLVDLPGLTKIPIGDQPTDIEKQTRILVLDYITKPNSIILAVSPANVDLVNSESLKLAKQVDPEGKRTIGVLTKLDLMDAGTNALDVLTGRVIPLKLGFIGVVNRSQQDIIGNKPMSEALKAESEFFKRHSAYRSIASRCGTPFLAKILNHILMNHIRERLPDMKARINALISQTTQELLSYGDPALDEKTNKGALVLKLITKFSNDFVASIDGTALDISTKELCGGARIYYIFNNIFGTALQSISPCGNLSVQDIRTAIRNSTGPRPSLFVPEIAFDLLVKPQVLLLEQPSLRCVELVHEELTKICHSCGNQELGRYPRLHAKLIEVVADLLRERLSPTSSYVESLISIQRAYVNTNHPDFIGGAGAMSDLVKKSEKKRKEYEKLNRRANLGGNTTHISTLSGPSISSKDDIPDGLPLSDKESSGSKDIGLQNGIGNNSSWTQRESFLTYFFGSGNKSDRTVLPDQPLPSRNGTSVKTGIDMDDTLFFLKGAIIDDAVHLTDHEEMEIQLIRSLITSYFNLVRKTIQDLVPKAIMHLLVNYSRESVQNRLVSELYKEELFVDLLQEDENLASKRQNCKTMLDVYRKAFDIMNEAM
ncbi:Dynamin central region-domain-containing protein [Gigaspora margarita]|uniref:dynamin GTPase n=1 Tax=Gigaspora margarita TaxID=4874 RepID=A0A8H4AB79_GIGMA|nr:Dynamin central region-domain-containing protein [Gigaspora margarita]